MPTSSPSTSGRPLDFLRDALHRRQERNASYSLSAFARDLGISVSLLSRVLSGERAISFKLAVHAAAALDMRERESNAFILSVVQNAPRTAKISKKLRAKLERELSSHVNMAEPVSYSSVELERFRAVANWYHLAILNLTATDGFVSKPSWIAKQLKIRTREAKEAIDRLIAIGLLAESEGHLVRSGQNFFVKTRQSDQAVRSFHKQMIHKASDELEKTSAADFNARLINGITFACSEDHLEAIKDKIDRLQDEILGLVSTGSKKRVYQMNVQFFPLTQPHIHGDSK